MDNYRFLLSGGGTGGHIYPAIAIADELKKRYPAAEFLFVGAKDRMEMQRVPEAGYSIKGLWISGLERKLSWKNLVFPLKLISSLMQARKIIREFKPHLVIGTGGFASGPTLRMAAAKQIPVVLQEQNSYAGITNKWLAKRAAKIFVAYKGMQRFFPEESLVFTGNPVRGNLSQALPEKEAALKQFGLNPQQQTLLILGGSLGARRINQLIEAELDFFKACGVQLLWQCGKGYFEQYKHYDDKQVRVCDFIREMPAAYAAADLIISRAGAGSVSELSLVGKPVIFIPSPNVAEDHQTKNAEAIAAEGAAVLIREAELETAFEDSFKALWDNKEQRQLMGERIKKLARPKATEQIVDEITEILAGK